MVERRGFEPLTAAVEARARLTGSSLPFLVGDVGIVRDNAKRSRTTAHPRLRSPSERPSGGVGQANPAGPEAGSSASPRESVAR